MNITNKYYKFRRIDTFYIEVEADSVDEAEQKVRALDYEDSAWEMIYSEIVED